MHVYYVLIESRAVVSPVNVIAAVKDVKFVSLVRKYVMENPDLKILLNHLKWEGLVGAYTLTKFDLNKTLSQSNNSQMKVTIACNIANLLTPMTCASPSRVELLPIVKQNKENDVVDDTEVTPPIIVSLSTFPLRTTSHFKEIVPFFLKFSIIWISVYTASVY